MHSACQLSLPERVAVLETRLDGKECPAWSWIHAAGLIMFTIASMLLGSLLTLSFQGSVDESTGQLGKGLFFCDTPSPPPCNSPHED